MPLQTYDKDPILSWLAISILTFLLVFHVCLCPTFQYISNIIKNLRCKHANAMTKPSIDDENGGGCAIFCPAIYQYKYYDDPKPLKISRVFYHYLTTLYIVLTITKLCLGVFHFILNAFRGNDNEQINCYYYVMFAFMDKFLLRSLFNIIIITRLHVIYYDSFEKHTHKLPYIIMIIELSIFIGYIIIYITTNNKDYKLIAGTAECSMNNYIAIWYKIARNIYDFIVAMVSGYLFVSPLIRLTRHSRNTNIITTKCQTRNTTNYSISFVSTIIKYCIITGVLEVITITSLILEFYNVHKIEIFEDIIDCFGLLVMFKEYEILYTIMFGVFHYPVLYCVQKTTKFLNLADQNSM